MSPLKRSLLNILDGTISEIDNRFSKGVLAGTAADDVSLKNEILVAKPMLIKKCPKETDLSTVYKHLQEYPLVSLEAHGRCHDRQLLPVAGCLFPGAQFGGLN